jgi:hypothetical protein
MDNSTPQAVEAARRPLQRWHRFSNYYYPELTQIAQKLAYDCGYESFYSSGRADGIGCGTMAEVRFFAPKLDLREFATTAMQIHFAELTGRSLPDFDDPITWAEWLEYSREVDEHYRMHSKYSEQCWMQRIK